MGHRTDQEDSLQYRQRLGAGPLLFRIRGVEEDREGDWAAVKSVAQEWEQIGGCVVLAITMSNKRL